jgi:hypothetical protein
VLLVSAEDAQRLVDQQLASGQNNVALDRKTNGAFCRRICDRLTERSRSGTSRLVTMRSWAAKWQPKAMTPRRA